MLLLLAAWDLVLVKSKRSRVPQKMRTCQNACAFGYTIFFSKNYILPQEESVAYLMSNPNFVNKIKFQQEPGTAPETVMPSDSILMYLEKYIIVPAEEKCGYAFHPRPEREGQIHPAH